MAGAAGERFAVRNSGAEAVVEGLGAHGCEYMTGGRVVVLGSVGWNLAAGMSGGELFVLDADGRAAQALNGDMAGVGRIDAEAETRLKALIEAHASATASPLAKRVLADWTKFAPRFVRIAPRTVLAAEAAETDVRLAQPA
ncbi:Glutamate synthase [NADPH] large chain [compost metagenome]